jgi:predicted permease
VTRHGREGREARARAVFRLLLRFYPSWFRSEYGQAMTETFLEAWRHAPAGGLRRVPFWLRAARDAVTEGLAERAARRWRPFFGLSADLRLVLRSLRRRPGFAVLVAATLGLGVGANVAVLALVDAVLLRPLPVAEPESLVEVFEALNERSPRGGMAYGTFRRLVAQESATAGMAAHLAHEVEIQAGDVADVVATGLVSGRYFEVLGVPAARGRTLVPADETEPGGARAVVISDALWRRLFGRDPGVVGSTLRLSGSVFTVVGVAPPGFRGLSLASAMDAWVPATAAGAVAGLAGVFSVPEALETPMFKVFDVVARLPEGADLEAVVSALNRARLGMDAESLAEGVARPMSALPVREAAALSSRVDLVRFLTLLAGVVGVTFLVACVNVANLLLVRARQRRRELAVRAALGGRLFRELALEALVLGGVGGLAAILVARGTMAVLGAFSLPGGVPVARAELEVGPAVAGLSVLLGLASALLFGLLPAWRAGHAARAGGLRTSGGGDGGGWGGSGSSAPGPGGLLGGLRGWGALLALQTGLSVVLLVSAALFGRTLQQALRTDLGFRADSVAAVTVRLRAHGVSGSDATALVDAVLAETRAHEGAGRAALALHVPLAPLSVGLPFEAPDGIGAVSGSMNLNIVTPEYFDVLGIPLRSGRLFDERDSGEGTPAIIVNEAAAALLWPGQNPLGRQGKITFNREPATVVGVVGQVTYHDLTEEDVPYVYYPLPQQLGIALDQANLVARGPRGSAGALEALRAAVQAVDPGLPLLNARSVERQIDDVLAPQRFGATLFTLFSVLALAISTVGIYGVAAYIVAARRRDIGVRMALGARRGAVVRGVLGGTLAATLAGTLLGVAGATALADLLDAFLYDIAPQDPLAFGAAVGALLLAALVAAALPARRAVRVDPVESMRAE